MLTRLEDMVAWKTARELTRLIFELIEKPELSWDYSLEDQIRRASVSTMSDIAEGFESRAQRLFVDMLGRSKGSVAEVPSDLNNVLDRKYITQEDFARAFNLADKTARQIATLMIYLKSAPSPRRRTGSAERSTLNVEDPMSAR